MIHRFHIGPLGPDKPEGVYFHDSVHGFGQIDFKPGPEGLSDMGSYDVQFDDIVAETGLPLVITPHTYFPKRFLREPGILHSIGLRAIHEMDKNPR